MHVIKDRFLLLSLIAGLLAGLPFLAGFPGAFVFDDFPNIVNNQAIQMTQLDAGSLAKAALSPQPSGSLRALPTLTFAVDYWRGGGADPATFKATNVLLHCLTTLAMAWLFRSVLLLAGVPAGKARWLAPSWPWHGRSIPCRYRPSSTWSNASRRLRPCSSCSRSWPTFKDGSHRSRVAPGEPGC